MKPLIVLPQQDVALDGIICTLKKHREYIISNCYVCLIVTNKVDLFKKTLVEREDVICMIYDVYDLPASYLLECEELPELSVENIRFLHIP